MEFHSKVTLLTEMALTQIQERLDPSQKWQLHLTFPNFVKEATKFGNVDVTAISVTMVQYSIV